MPTNPPSNQDETDQTTTNRRTVLHGVGAVGILGIIGTGAAAARGHTGRGNPQEECACPTEADGSGTYEFVEEDGNCYFEFEQGDDLVTITDWDSKAGEECEPETVDYEAVEGYRVIQVCAFGGNDNDVDEDPDGTYEADLTNPGSQDAAISNITFCVEEVITGTAGTGWSDTSANNDFNMEATYGDGTSGTGSGLSEIKIDGATPGNEAQFDWVDDATVGFVGEYDGTDAASFDVDGTVVSGTVAQATAGDLAVTVKTAPPNEAGLTAEVENLMINDTPVVPSSVTAVDPGTGDREIRHIEVTGLDFSGGVKVEGDLTFDFDGKNPVSSGPAMVIDFN